MRAIDRYLNFRRALPPSAPGTAILPEDEDEKVDLVAHLTEEEKKHREE